MAHKLCHLIGDEWMEHSHAPVFRLPEAEDRSKRIIIGVPSQNSEVFYRLVSAMPPPYLLLYVLHTPRGEGGPGRYQSPELTLDEFTKFYETFSTFLGSDGRFDIWAHAPHEGSTVAWDRHNLLFAYGRLDRFKAALADMGFREGSPTVPAPHEHHYRPEFDPQAKAMLAWFDWQITPLRPEDEQ